jgi:molybdenum cofactor cytidylyltransferase
VETGPDLEFVENPGYGEGLSASLRKGLEAARGFDAVLIVLGDLPFLGTELARAVVGAYRTSTAPLAFPRVDGRPAHPVVFRRDLWAELDTIRGDRGGRTVVDRHAKRAAVVPWEDGGTQRDIDTEGEYGTLRQGE